MAFYRGTRLRPILKACPLGSSEMLTGAPVGDTFVVHTEGLWFI